MKKNDAWLDGISVASPCPAEWDAMAGDDRCRFCSQCKLHVFDLSAMTRPEAEKLVRSTAGAGADRLCVRFARRADGTVLTRDCPVGVRQRIKKVASRLVAACVAMLAFVGCRRMPPPADNGGEPIEILPTQGEMTLEMGDVEEPRRLLGRIRLIDVPKSDAIDGKGNKH